MSVPTETVPCHWIQSQGFESSLGARHCMLYGDASGHARERELASELKQLEREVQVNGDRKSKMVQ
jgi:hypothetical protein